MESAGLGPGQADAALVPTGAKFEQMDRRRPSVVFGGDIKAVNAFVKQAKLTKSEIEQLRKARRRHKNWSYAKASRTRKPSDFQL